MCFEILTVFSNTHKCNFHFIKWIFTQSQIWIHNINRLSNHRKFDPLYENQLLWSFIEHVWHKKRKYWHRKNLELRKIRTNSKVGNSTTGTAIQGITVGHIGMGISATPSFLDWFLHCASILNFFRRCALHFFLYFLHRYIRSIFFGSCIGIL